MASMSHLLDIQWYSQNKHNLFQQWICYAKHDSSLTSMGSHAIVSLCSKNNKKEEIRKKKKAVKENGGIFKEVSQTSEGFLNLLLSSFLKSFSS